MGRKSRWRSFMATLSADLRGCGLPRRTDSTRLLCEGLPEKRQHPSLLGREALERIRWVRFAQSLQHLPQRSLQICFDDRRMHVALATDRGRVAELRCDRLHAQEGQRAREAEY